MSTTVNTGLSTRTSFGLRGRVAETRTEAGAFDTELWQRLEHMQLDAAGAEVPFSKRLADEHKWTAAEARRAICEYKRFLYLTQRAGFEVTPSRPVDLVWHEHLMHTQHYWGTLCREVLRNDLHHKPGTGGAGDGDRLMAQYTRTLVAYQDAFGHEPPADIWPHPSTNSARSGPLAALVASFAVMVAGIALKIWPLAIICGIVCIFSMVAAANASDARNRKNDRGGCGSGCGGGGIGGSGNSDGSGSDSGGGDGGGGCGGGGD